MAPALKQQAGFIVPRITPPTTSPALSIAPVVPGASPVSTGPATPATSDRAVTTAPTVESAPAPLKATPMPARRDAVQSDPEASIGEAADAFGAVRATAPTTGLEARSAASRVAPKRRRRATGQESEKRGRQGDGGGRPSIYEVPMEKKTVQLTPGLQEKLKAQIIQHSRRTGAMGIGPSTVYNGAGEAVLDTGFFDVIEARTPREIQAAFKEALSAYVAGQGRRQVAR